MIFYSKLKKQKIFTLYVEKAIYKVYINIITDFKERRNSYNKYIYIIRGLINENFKV